MEQQLSTLIMFGLLFVFIYFFMVRPNKKARLEHQRMVDAIEAGDEVMTTTGIFGTVRSVGDEEMKLEIAPGIEIRMVKRAIASRVTEGLDDADETETQTEDERATENA